MTQKHLEIAVIGGIIAILLSYFITGNAVIAVVGTVIGVFLGLYIHRRFSKNPSDSDKP